MAVRCALIALAFLAVPASPLVAQPPVTAVADPAKDAIAEGLSFFLMDAMKLRSDLRNRGMIMRADSLWESATRLAAAVREADPDDQPLFLPVFKSLRAVMGEIATAAGDPDLEALTALQATLDDQIRIQTAPGIDSAAKGGVDVTVHALRNGAAANGFYAWVDLTGAVSKTGDGRALPGVTPARGRVTPGRYLVRIVDGAKKPLGSKVQEIGKTGWQEDITVILP